MNLSLMANQSVDAAQMQVQRMEIAARNVDKSLNVDYNAPRLIDLMNINPQTGSTASGLTDGDYPSLNGIPLSVNMTQIKAVGSVPLPPEIVDHFRHVQCHCMMGIFPEISRAWLTVDSDIYIWTYEENTDLAYFDGINETILCVGLVKPKPGVFHAFIKYLLVLSTAVDIVVLGVTFTKSATGIDEEIQLVPDPVFTLPTDGATISVVSSTNSGRIFLGTKEGSLFEISYQAESGWFGKRCKKINLSTSALSFLVPSFLNAALSEEDGIVQIAIDNSRHILYALTEKGAIEVSDLGEKGTSFSRITKVSQNTLVNQAMNTVKTLDSQNFRPIISISAIEAYESNNLNLVAISQTGVRFYLSVVGLSNQAPNQRPYALCLAHVRLPPGYSANITVRPRSVHMAQYRDRNMVLVSNVKDKDVLWCISSDLFPFSHTLMEAYTTLDLDGPALALAEVRHDAHIYSNQLQEAPPLVVRQHAEAPKKYVVLTSHSVQTFIKLRPVDLLRQILKTSCGHDTEALKTFFMIQKEDQACATSLILASLESEENFDISELAARAFFIFGGEPKLVPINQTNVYAGSTMFTPNIVSTPASSYPQNLYQQSPNLSQTMSPLQRSQTYEAVSPISFSAKHNGLYLYLSRILRPIWNRTCVEKVCLDGKTVTNQSTINVEDCVCILNNLTALHNFLTVNTQLSAIQQSTVLNASVNATVANPTIQDAQLEERKSLDALKLLVCYCCQIVGLWKVLCEHQFHNLIGSLPENQQFILQNMTFKELFLYRHDVCSVLITTLVNSYLGDNASVDSISSKLMEVCPHLYKTEDAAFSKANELLKTMRTIQNRDEKEEMLHSALELCKNIAPNVNLNEVCKQFTALKAYNAVIELCEHCAKKIDPDRIAENFYENDNASDQEGFNYYRKRMEIYKEIVNMLEVIYGEQTGDQLPASDYNPYATDSKSVLLNGPEPTQMGYSMMQVVNSILELNDEIMHLALYEWMISKDMHSDLIKIANPSLERFLKRTSVKNPDNITVMDLMWKFYESNNNHAAAAKILNNLASRPGSHVNLKERLAYLARAIMCMRSDKVGYAPCLGVFLRDLEDKMEVARVQEQILDAVTSLRNQIPNSDDAIKALNSGLYEISQLYENFAEPFNLLECQLAIIDCAGYTDSLLIESLWQQILGNELKKSTGSGSERISQVLLKVKQLARQYAQSKCCFPLYYIVYELEMVNARLKGHRTIVPLTLASIDYIPFDKLMETYATISTVSFNDAFWQIEENEFHLSEAVAALIECFIERQQSFSNGEKRKIISIAQDTVTTLLSNLYSKANTGEIVHHLRRIQSKLSRI